MDILLQMAMQALQILDNLWCLKNVAQNVCLSILEHKSEQFYHVYAVLSLQRYQLCKEF